MILKNIYLKIALFALTLMALVLLIVLNNKKYVSNTHGNANIKLAAIDILSNSINFLDNTNKLIGNTIIGKRDDVGIIDGDFSPNGYFYGLIENNPNSNKKTSFNMFIINTNKFQITDELNLDILPANIAITPKGLAYITHNFEYRDGSGWMVSIFNTNTNKKIEEIKISGAPGKPKVINNDVYIPMMGGGERHFGNSNVVKITADGKKINLFYDDFSEIPPTDFIIYDNIFYGIFVGQFNAINRPMIKKDITNGKTYLISFPINNSYQADGLEIDNPSGTNADSLFATEKEIYIHYTLIDSTLSDHSGLIIFNKDKKIFTENTIVEEKNWNINAVDIDDSLLIANPSQKIIKSFNKINNEFLEDNLYNFTPNYLMVNNYANLIPKYFYLTYDSKYNFRQTTNDCGPFNVAAIIRQLTNKDVSSDEFSKQIKWRLPNKYTLPIGLELQLKQNGIKIKMPKIATLSNDQKIDFLKEQLSQNQPIIILGKQNNYQHYITLFGFNSSDDQFYIYDSLHNKAQNGLTEDANGEYPGNRSISSKELIDFWQGGGMFGLYKWYAIINSL